MKSFICLLLLTSQHVFAAETFTYRLNLPINQETFSCRIEQWNHEYRDCVYRLIDGKIPAELGSFRSFPVELNSAYPKGGHLIIAAAESAGGLARATLVVLRHIDSHSQSYLQFYLQFDALKEATFYHMIQERPVALPPLPPVAPKPECQCYNSWCVPGGFCD